MDKREDGSFPSWRQDLADSNLLVDSDYDSLNLWHGQNMNKREEEPLPLDEGKTLLDADFNLLVDVSLILSISDSIKAVGKIEK